MALTSKITPYDTAWPARFRAERDRVAPVFSGTLTAIHHVGSTAVPDLAAKPEIDILIVVTDHRNSSEIDAFLQPIGYVRGKNLSADHHFYRKDVKGVRTHKLHVCTQGHYQISRMLHFRDLLRRNPELRHRYQHLKLKLEAENTEGIGEYLAGKAPFIDAVLETMSTD